MRAAARRFARRHRRDASFLNWVLRALRMSSGLAVVLLGFSGSPASAELAPFRALTGAANPIPSVDLGGFTRAGLADLDGDGDLDLTVGETSPILNYFENTRSAVDPGFLQRTGAANPFNGATLTDRSTPAFGDLDGDGDFDLLIGDYVGQFVYFENTGDPTTPLFVRHFGSLNPMDGVDVGLHASPALGDLDADGDLDLLVGELYGGFLYYENTGTVLSPAFAAQTGATNPLHLVDVGDSAVPSLADLDGDGDLDLVAGEVAGAFFVYENTGSVTSAVFVARTDAANPLAGHNVGGSSAPSLGDLDGDGDPDLAAGELDGLLNSFENQLGSFAVRTGSDSPLNGLDVGTDSLPALADLDDDGDLDLVAGKTDGTFAYFKNTGSVAAAVFLAQTGAANPLDGRDLGALSVPAFGDLDADGDLDLLATGGQAFVGASFYDFKNTGSATTAAFAEQTGSANPMDGESVAYLMAPILGDLDADGDLDLVVGYGNLSPPTPSGFAYFENTGNATNPVFIERTGAANPLDGEQVPTTGAGGSLGDVEGDGDLDLVANAGHYFENTGSATSADFAARTGSASPLNGNPSTASLSTLGDLDTDGDLDVVHGDTSGTFHYSASFVRQQLPAFELTGAANPLDGQDVGYRSTLALGDLDRDGDLDVIAAESLGTFRYFENTGSATAPAFAARTGTANPMNGYDIGADVAVALGDLDTDGDLDLVAGEDYGFFFYFENTTTTASPVFIQRTGSANPLNGFYNGGDDSSPAIGDLDRDGDLDLIAGNHTGVFRYYENTGPAESPAFVLRTGAANPLDGADVYGTARPTLGDFDLDGDLDLVSGNHYGDLHFFQNAGSSEVPAFVKLTGAANPLDGENVGSRSAPAAGDLDGDGDTDLATGSQAGTFAVHYFPEPARVIILAAGAALLRWLSRRRN